MDLHKITVSQDYGESQRPLSSFKSKDYIVGNLLKHTKLRHKLFESLSKHVKIQLETDFFEKDDAFRCEQPFGSSGHMIVAISNKVDSPDAYGPDQTEFLENEQESFDETQVRISFVQFFIDLFHSYQKYVKQKQNNSYMKPYTSSSANNSPALLPQAQIQMQMQGEMGNDTTFDRRRFLKSLGHYKITDNKYVSAFSDAFVQTTAFDQFLTNGGINGGGGIGSSSSDATTAFDYCIYVCKNSGNNSGNNNNNNKLRHQSQSSITASPKLKGRRLLSVDIIGNKSITNPKFLLTKTPDTITIGPTPSASDGDGVDGIDGVDGVDGDESKSTSGTHTHTHTVTATTTATATGTVTAGGLGSSAGGGGGIGIGGSSGAVIVSAAATPMTSPDGANAASIGSNGFKFTAGNASNASGHGGGHTESKDSRDSKDYRQGSVKSSRSKTVTVTGTKTKTTGGSRSSRSTRKKKSVYELPANLLEELDLMCVSSTSMMNHDISANYCEEALIIESTDIEPTKEELDGAPYSYDFFPILNQELMKKYFDIFNNITLPNDHRISSISNMSMSINIKEFHVSDGNIIIDDQVSPFGKIENDDGNNKENLPETPMEDENNDLVKQENIKIDHEMENEATDNIQDLDKETDDKIEKNADYDENEIQNKRINDKIVEKNKKDKENDD